MSASSSRMETYYAGAYWGSRKESALDCSVRTESMLAALASSDSSFSRWFKQARTIKESLNKPLDPTREALEKWFQRGVMRSDGGTVMTDLGYSVSAWNGERDEYDDSDFHLSCGVASPQVRNACVFKLPSRVPNAERVINAPILLALVRSLAVAWEPDWAVAMSHTHRDVMKPAQPRTGPYVAWVTYLARHRGTVPPLPAPVRVELVEDKGTLILLTPERFTAENAAHVELAWRVRERLEEAGLLEPIPR